MSKVKNLIEGFFDGVDLAGLAKEYAGREIEFFTERGRLYPEKLEEIFYAIFNRVQDDIIIIGPRGGGKTMGVYDSATARFLFHRDDVFAIGGSESQARNGFKYVKQILNDKKVSELVPESLNTAATSPYGNWFNIAAASSKGVRGPHPGDMHPEMGWVIHGGMLIKDERDEMADEISDAADFMMDTADPSTIVTTSTMHRADGGGIAQMAEEAEARGAVVYKFDIFDVSEVCEHDCAKCPAGHAFAGALLGGKKVKTPNKFGAKHPVPAVTAESQNAWEKWKKENAWPEGEEAFCGGRAKMHRPGHMKMSKIFRSFRRSRNIDIFATEHCCRKRKGAKRVLDGARLDMCLSPEVQFQPGYAEPIITIDWGFKGWTVLCLVQPQMDQTIAVIEVRYEHMTDSDELVEICKAWMEEYGAWEVFADSSHSFENSKLSNEGFQVTEVAFVKYKEFGAGWLRGLVERKKLRIRGKLHRSAEKPEYVFYSQGEEDLFNQLKGWQRDDNGKIVKKEDHGCDSLLCASLKFAEETEYDGRILGTGRRGVSGGTW